MDGVERRNDPRKLRHWIVGAVRIGDMALRAWHVDPHVDRAASSDLDRIAEAVDRRRLANQDHVGPDSTLIEPVDDPRRAEGGIALLVAGDEEREGALVLWNQGCRRGEGGDGALHVVGAAPVETAIFDHRRERVAGPSFAGRHNVEMACKAEVRRTDAADRDHVLRRSVRLFAEDEAMDIETERQQRFFQQIEHLATRRRDAWAGDERRSEIDRIDHALTFTKVAKVLG